MCGGASDSRCSLAEIIRSGLLPRLLTARLLTARLLTARLLTCILLTACLLAGIGLLATHRVHCLRDLLLGLRDCGSRLVRLLGCLRVLRSLGRSGLGLRRLHRRFHRLLRRVKIIERLFFGWCGLCAIGLPQMPVCFPHVAARAGD